MDLFNLKDERKTNERRMKDKGIMNVDHLNPIELSHKTSSRGNS